MNNWSAATLRAKYFGSFAGIQLSLVLLLSVTPFVLEGCASSNHKASAAPLKSLYPQKLAEIDSAITVAISSNKLPGAVLWIEHNGAKYERSYGQSCIEPPTSMNSDVVFDMASLTKVLATTPSIMLLYERGKIEIDAPVSKYLPEFNSPAQQPITIRHLMTHTSGLRPGIGGAPAWSGYEH